MYFILRFLVGRKDRGEEDGGLRGQANKAKVRQRGLPLCNPMSNPNYPRRKGTITSHQGRTNPIYRHDRAVPPPAEPEDQPDHH